MPDIARRTLRDLNSSFKSQAITVVGMGTLCVALAGWLGYQIYQQVVYQQYLDKAQIMFDLNVALLDEMAERHRGICCDKAVGQNSVRYLEDRTDKAFDQFVQAYQHIDHYFAESELRTHWKAFQLQRIKPISCNPKEGCIEYHAMMQQSLQDFQKDLLNRFDMQLMMLPLGGPKVIEPLALSYQLLKWRILSYEILTNASFYGRTNAEFWRTHVNRLQPRQADLQADIQTLKQGFEGNISASTLEQVDELFARFDALNGQFLDPVLITGQFTSDWWSSLSNDEFRMRQLFKQVDGIIDSLYAELDEQSSANFNSTFFIGFTLLLFLSFLFVRVRKFYQTLYHKAFFPAASRQAVIEESSYGVLVFYPNGEIEYCNPKAQYIIGKFSKDMIGTNIQEYFLDIPLDISIQEWLAAWKQEHSTTRTLTLHSSHRHQLPVISGLGSYHLDNVERYFLTFKDSRKIEQAQRQLSQQTRLFEALKNAASDFVDSKGTEEVWDDLLSSLLMITESEYGFIGEVIYKDDAPCLKIHALTNIAWDEAATNLFESLKSQNMLLCNTETLIGRAMVTKSFVISNDVANDPRGGHLPPGHPDLNKYMGVPIFKGDELVGVYGLANRHEGYSEELVEFLEPFHVTCGALIAGIREKTAKSELMHHLEVAKREAEATTMMKSEFLANMSHEIRTPMNGILGMAYLALKSGLNDAQKDYVTKIHRSANHLLSIINDILDFSKIESGKIELEHIPLQIEEVVEDSILPVQSMAQKKQLELVVNIVPELSYCGQPSLKGDPVRIAQILINLLSNAVKFTDSGQVQLNVAIHRYEGESCWIEFAVIDSGIGMTKEQQGGLFQAFSQADASVNRKYGGTGLGLVISRGLAQEMGGDLSFSSIYKEGSKFSLLIPLETPPVRVEHKCPTFESNIVVIDDNPIVASQIKTMMLGFGLQCEAFTSAQAFRDALPTLNKQSIEWLFVDWVMPEEDGIELLYWLREKVPLLADKFVLMSFYDSEKLQQTAQSHQIQNTLAKPILPAHLAALLRPDDLSIRRHRSLHPPMAENRIPNLEGKNILLVEDNRLNQQIAQEMLSVTNASVMIAENGELAIQKLTNFSSMFDLVLMDLQMPVMGGIEATKIIRQHSHLANLPIIAMTAHAFSEEIDRCQKAGMNDHIPKPIIPENLYAKLAKYLQANRFVEMDSSLAQTLPAGKDVDKDSGELVQQTEDGLDVSGTLERVAELKDSSELFVLEDLPDSLTETPLDVAYHNLASLSGVDFQVAKALMPPTPGFFENMLCNFTKEYRSAKQTLQTLVETENLQDAIRFCHTLKGLSASFGLNALSQIMGRLEHAMSETENLPSLQDLVDFNQLHDSHWVLLEAYCQEFRPQTSPKQSMEALEPIVISFEETQALVAELLDKLEDFDAESMDFWQAHEAVFVLQFGPETSEQVAQMLEEFEFENAIALLKQQQQQQQQQEEAL